MKAKKIWANFGVRDLARTTQFYKQLGFQQNDASDQLTSFFFGEDQFIIHFFLKDVLEPGMKGRLLDSSAGNEIIFTLSAESKNEVDEWEKAVQQASGKCTIAWWYRLRSSATASHNRTIFSSSCSPVRA